ncbi:helix-turn-helix domain-containing protein, partial [Actinomadura adrarensis]
MTHPGEQDTEETRKRLGRRIQRLRQRTGVKKPAFARACGISYPHLDNIENGRKGASVELLHRIANNLDITYEELTTDETDRTDAQPSPRHPGESAQAPSVCVGPGARSDQASAA